MEVLDWPPTVEDFSFLRRALAVLAAEQVALLAQLIAGRFFLTDDAIAGRIGFAPLVPMPIFVPDLVLESTPITGHRTPPYYATTIGRQIVTNLNENKRRSTQRAKRKPAVQARRTFAKARHLRV